MKILVLYPHPLEPDGQSLQGFDLACALSELGVEVMHCNRDSNIQKWWAYESFKPDVAIGIGFWGNSPDLLFDPINKGVKAIPWFNADGWVANYHEIFEKLPLLVATSNWVKNTYMRDGLSGKNIEVISIGFNPKDFYPKPRTDAGVKKMRELLGIEEDEIMIFTAGGDVTSKGAQEMLKCLAKIDKEFPKWKYVLKTYDSFSARNHGKEEHALIKELGLDEEKIIYLDGKFDHRFMAELINACDIYAAPSRLEGFGMIQLEAQACAKPVISINVGGPKDVILHEKTGYLVDVESEIKLEKEWVYPEMGFKTKHQIPFKEPKTFAYRANIDQLAKYTLMLMKSPELREKMGKAAAEHALNNFDRKIIAKKMLKLIEKHVINSKLPEIGDFKRVD